jgi:hypothetical protein
LKQAFVVGMDHRLDKLYFGMGREREEAAAQHRNSSDHPVLFRQFAAGANPAPAGDYDRCYCARHVIRAPTARRFARLRLARQSAPVE